MQAAVIETAGSPPRVVEQESPRPAGGMLRIAVKAAPITPLDRLCASGTSYFGRPQTPYVPGVQGVGIVEQPAEGRAQRGGSIQPGSIQPGALVWFATKAGMAPGDGSMREYACAQEQDVVPLTAGSDPALVAALGLSAVAAWMALAWRGGLERGERVLVLGAGGVVGQAAVQLARTAGAAQVIAASRTPHGRERATRLGADAVVPLHPDDGVDALAERMREASDGPVDLVLDALFGVPAAAALRTLRDHGRLVNLGSSEAETAPIESAVLRSRSLRILGYTNNELTPEQIRDAITFVDEQAHAGRLTVAFEPVPLAEVAAAWPRTTGGRVVLIP